MTCGQCGGDIPHGALAHRCVVRKPDRLSQLAGYVKDHPGLEIVSFCFWVAAGLVTFALGVSLALWIIRRAIGY